MVSDGRCRVCSASANDGKFGALQPSGVLPFRQRRDFRQRCICGLPHRVERQAFGERIDRLDHRQLVELGFAHHAVGMHHLQHAVVERGRARHVAQFADREELFEVVALGVEIGERQRAGVVIGLDSIGQARAVRRRRPVAVDSHRDGRDRARHHVAEFRARAAVDRSGRQMEQQIDRRAPACPRGRTACGRASQASARRPEAWSARQTADRAARGAWHTRCTGF